MCGIVGVINGSTTHKTKLDEVFNEMLWIDQIRGTDGAGVFWYNKKDNVYHVVKSKNIDNVLNNEKYRAARRWMAEIPFMVGHNRAATRGEVSSDNNHPFDEGNVVLVHNGTMSYIPKEYDDGTKVDSHAIAKMLHKASVEEFMRKSFGAFALVWFNKTTQQLNLLRNEDRPLHIIKFEDISLISSEAGLATWLGSRFGFKFVCAEALKPYHLYQFNPFNLEPTVTDLTKEGKKYMSEYSSGVLPVVHRRNSELFRNYYGDDADDDEAEAFGARVLDIRTDKVIPIGDSTKARKLKGAQDFYEQLSPYRYWFQLHPSDKSPAPIAENKSEISKNKVVLKVGEEVHFGVDRATSHNRRGYHSLIFGTLPGNPIQAFEVRAHTKAPVDKIKNSNYYWKGKIIALNMINHQKTMVVQVADAEESEIPNPDFAIGVHEKN